MVNVTDPLLLLVHEVTEGIHDIQDSQFATMVSGEMVKCVSRQVCLALYLKASIDLDVTGLRFLR